MKTVYLDNSATTALSFAAREKMLEAMDKYGNPSSLHHMGLEAHTMLEEARAQICESLGMRGVSCGKLIFTSCGSEASNAAILGSIYSKERRVYNRIVTTDCEHPSVEKVMQLLEKRGFEIIRLTTRSGVIDDGQLEDAFSKPPLLVSIMMVNNETGAVFNVKKIFDRARRVNPEVITHCDAVQGYLKCRFTPMSIGADFITVSAHKIHGPKGVGALYISPAIIKARRFIPYINGGGQEDGFRSGTENIVGIAGFGAAAADGYRTLTDDIAKMTALRTYAEKKLSDQEIALNIPLVERAPHILNITLPGIKSETMLHHLSQNGVCVSSGSACSSHSNHPSSSLLAFGLTPEQADCSMRISVSADNTSDDIDMLVSALSSGLATLVRKYK